MKDIDSYKREFLWSSYASRYKENKRTICKDDVDGLLKWYFKTTEQPDTNSKETIELCAIRAYGDLHRNLRGIGGNPQKEQFKSTIYSKIVYAMQLLDDCTDFDDWHNALCKDIINCSESIYPISYGIAQKWVNMTLKYLLICGYDFKEKETSLHVPVDSYIYKAFACKQSKNSYALFCPKAPTFHEGDGSGKLDYYRENGNNRTQPWSKLNAIDYENLQCSIREAIRDSNNKVINRMSLIEWEGAAWIEQAKIEKEKNKK